MIAALALVGLGWTAGTAQQDDTPDFELRIDAPYGRTTIECTGCDLTWIERSVPQRPTTPSPTFWYSCGGPDRTISCPSGKIGGRIRRER